MKKPTPSAAAAAAKQASDLIALSGQALQAGDLMRSLRLAEGALLLDPALPSGWHLRAVSHHHGGQAAPARRSITRTLRSRPAYPEAWNTFGNLAQAGGDARTAELAYRTSIALAPDFADPYTNLGGLAAEGRRGSLTLFRRALRIVPTNVNALFNAALQAPPHGEASNALYCNALVVEPALAAAWNNLGRLQDNNSDHRAAVVSFERAVRLNPGEAGFLANLGNAAASIQDVGLSLDATARALTLEPANSAAVLQLSRLQAGAEDGDPTWPRRALALDPTMFDAWLDLAATNIIQKRAEAAMAAAMAAVSLEPGNGDAWHSLALVAGMRAATRERELYALRRRVHLSPDSSLTHLDFARSYMAMGRPDLAEREAREAVERAPEDPLGWEALTLAYRDQWLLEDALRAARAAVSLAPETAQLLILHGLLLYYMDRPGIDLWYERAARMQGENAPLIEWNRSLLLLSRGNLHDGWAKYDDGLKAGLRKPIRTFPQPQWRGQDPTGKRFLIWREQGVGDEFVFASCYGDLIREAEHCIIECDRRLLSLFRRSFPQADIRADSSEQKLQPSDFDYHVACGSLPRYFRPRLEDFPDRPFLIPDPDRVQFWRRRFQALGGRVVVGICWRGRLKWMSRAALYAQLPDWGPILRQSDITFVSLQYGEPEEEIAAAEAAFGCRIHSFPDIDLLNDFDDVAAFGAALDLAITADTASGALMGAVGVPTWRYVTRGDYMSLGTERFPWMSSIRVFFRERDEPWSVVTGRIGAELKEQSGDLAREIVRVDAPEAGELAAYEPQLGYLVDAAVKHQQAGRLVPAAALYQKVLAYAPAEPLSLQLLGTIALRQGRYDAARPFLMRALTLRPDYVPAYVQLAATFQQAGRLPEAVHALRCALSWDPAHPEGLANLGECLANLGTYDPALSALRRAARLRPDLPEMETNLGNLRTAGREFAEAAFHHRRAIELRPGYVGAYVNLAAALAETGDSGAALIAWQRVRLLEPGNALAAANIDALERAARRIDVPDVLRSALARHRTGDLDAAERYYKEALLGDPRNADAVHLLGVVAVQRGLPAVARRRIEAALCLDPAFPQALTNLGRSIDDESRAAKLHRRALRLNADAIEANINLGSSLARLGAADEAAIQFRRVLRLAPAHGPVWSNLGDAESSGGRPQIGQRALSRALLLEPGHAQLYVNLGKAALAEGAIERAASLADTALLLAPDLWHAHNLLGMCRAAAGTYDRAERDFRRALLFVAGNATVRWNLSLLELQRGALAAGWDGYEAGLEMGARSLHDGSALPRWPGPGAAGRVLVRREQGLGDELLFATCYPDLAEQRVDAVCECDPRLAALLRRSFPTLAFVAEGEAATENCAWQIPAGSLPGLMRRRLQDFPSSGAFLKPDAGSLQRWRARLAERGDRPKIGICWRSSVGAAMRNLYYAAIDDLAPLLGLPGIDFVCLQHDMTEQERQQLRDRFGIELVVWSDLDLRDDLENVAALARSLDLVIAPETAVGVLTGAVGGPRWTFTNEGSWTLLGSGRDPWFPGSRVSTKRPGAGWQSLFDQMAVRLRAQFALPRGANAWNDALAALAAGRFADAATALRTVLATEPDHADALAELANLLRADGQLAPSIGLLERVLQLDPGHARGLTYLGLLFKDVENFDAAMICHRRALIVEETLNEAWTNLANAFVQLGHLPLARTTQQTALVLEPTNIIGWINLGGIESAQGQLDQAARLYARVNRLQPGNAAARWNRGLLSLGAGQLAEGWEGFDARFTANQSMPVRHVALPRWDGQDPTGQGLVVWSEQGIGDEIVFASCFPDLIAGAGRVVLECDPRLVPLWRRSFAGAEVRALGNKAALAGVSWQAPSGDVARWMRPAINRFPDRESFLVADPALTDVWRQRVANPDGGRTIGICWRGLRRNANRRAAYTDLRAWRDVLRLPGITWVSLQYGDADVELAEVERAFGITIQRWSDLDLKDDFDGVAALMMSLDLVIGPDTAATALAGALGRPTWKLTPPDDWMMLGTDRYPWLPTVRVFRRDGSWASVLGHIAEQLRRG